MAKHPLFGLPRWFRRCKRCGFHPWVRRMPWRKKRRPTLEFLPGKSHGQRSLVGYSPWGCKESDMTEYRHTSLISCKDESPGNS